MEKFNEELTIGEVARRVGLRPSAVRYYEKMGLLPLPKRVNGRRRYDPDILPLLTAIQFARQAGFTIAELQELFQPQGATAFRSTQGRELIYDKLTQLDQLIERIQQMKWMLTRSLECDCLQLEDCVIIDRDWWSWQL